MILECWIAELGAPDVVSGWWNWDYHEPFAGDA